MFNPRHGWRPTGRSVPFLQYLYIERHPLLKDNEHLAALSPPPCVSSCLISLCTFKLLEQAFCSLLLIWTASCLNSAHPFLMHPWKLPILFSQSKLNLSFKAIIFPKIATYFSVPTAKYVELRNQISASLLAEP